MKRLQFATILFASTALLFTSCKKENNEPAPDEQQAAEVVSQSISAERGGFVTQIDNSISIALRHNQPANCGKEKDTALAVNYSGLALSYAYNLNWNWKLTCTADVPTKINYTYKGTSAYNGITISSNDQILSSMELSGLAPSSSEYVLNKEVVREGHHTSSFGRQSNFQSRTAFSSSNIIVDKSSRKIKSGVVQVNITFGTNSNHQYQGKVTFNGNNTATLVLNSGRTYNIRW